MDGLAAYASENESDESCHSSEDQKSSSNGSFQKYVDDNCLSASEAGPVEQTEGSRGKNFFGLTSCTSQADLSETEEKADICELEKKEQILSRHVNIYGNSVEVPDSDFWTSLSEADSFSAGIEIDSTKPRKRKFESLVRTPKYSDQSSVLHSSFPNRLGCEKDLCMYSGAKYADQNSTISSFGHAYSVHKMYSGKLDSTQSDPKIKLYVVHPKISPYLNSQQSSRCACKEVHRWTGHVGAINRIAWCTNSSFSHLILSASMDSTVRIWNAWGQQQTCVRTLTTHTRAVRDAQWSLDGQQVLSCSFDHTAAVTDVQTGACMALLEHSAFVSAGKFSPVTSHLVATGTTDCVQLWDIRHPEGPIRIFSHKEQLGQIQDLMFSHDGRELFSCGDVVARESADRNIIAWDFQTGVVLSNQIFQERYTVTRMCLHPSYSQFVAQTQAGYVAVFSTQRPYKMNKNKRFEGHKGSGYNLGVSLSQDGSILYSGSSDGKLYCYSFNTGKKIRTLDCGQILLDVAAHPVLPSVVAGSTWDGDIVLFQ